MQDFHKNIDECTPAKRRKILIVFDDMVANMTISKQCNPILTVLFIRRRKRNISLILHMQSYFKVPKYVRLNFTHYYILKTWNKQVLTNFNKRSTLNKLQLIIHQIEFIIYQTLKILCRFIKNAKQNQIFS